MDQLRDSLSETVATTSAQVQEAVSSVTDRVSEAAAEIDADEGVAAEGVKVEVVEEPTDAPAAEDAE